MSKHEGSRLGFESTRYKGRMLTTRLGVLPATVPNKRIRTGGNIATPLVHDLPAHISALRDWRVEYLVGMHAGEQLWLPASRGPWVRDLEAARRLGHSPGYRLLVRDTDTDTYIVDLPAKAVTGNPDTDSGYARHLAPASKRSKMIPYRG